MRPSDMLKSRPSKLPPTATKIVEQKASSKYDVLTRPSRKLINVGRALHEASERLGMFRG